MKKMSKHFVISVSGMDMVGKHTQACLLHRALEESGEAATLMSFPEYGRPIGRMIKALYHDVEIKVDLREDQYYGPFAEGSGVVQRHDALYTQTLQSLARIEAQDRIEAALERGHIVMDRYDWDGVLYGLAEGLPLPQLLFFQSLIKHPSDFVFFVRGQGFDVKRTLDSNEKDRSLIARLYPLCAAMPAIASCRAYDIDTAIFETVDALASIQLIHERICHELRVAGIVTAKALSTDEVKVLLEAREAASG